MKSLSKPDDAILSRKVRVRMFWALVIGASTAYGLLLLIASVANALLK